MARGENWKAYIFIALVVALIVAGYFTFFFYHSCDDLSCYYGLQKQCSKVSFVNDQDDATWRYRIEGKEDGKCEVEVTVLSVKEGDIDQQVLEGKNMICLLPMGSSAAPEGDISRCSGLLKESLQDLLIQKLHRYIVDNVGKIGEELQSAI